MQNQTIISSSPNDISSASNAMLAFGAFSVTFAASAYTYLYATLKPILEDAQEMEETSFVTKILDNFFEALGSKEEIVAFSDPMNLRHLFDKPFESTDINIDVVGDNIEDV